MLDAADLAEMRALQARAYGRDGGLDAAEASRLRDLMRRAARPVRPEPAAPTVPRSAGDLPNIGGSAPDTVRSSADLRGSDDVATDVSVDVPTAEVAEPTRFRHVLLRRWRTLLLGVVVTLVLGIGLGWMLFAPAGAEAVVLTPAQQEWQAELVADDDYDHGSVRPIAVEAGVVLWFATQSDGKRLCLVMGNGTRNNATCDRDEIVRESGLYGTMVVEHAEGQTEVSGQLILTRGGEPAVIVSSYENGPLGNVPTYDTDDDERFAALLVDQGFDQNSVWPVGRDGDNPIWTGARPDEGTQCLIYGSTSEVLDMRCESSLDSGGLWVEHVDDKTRQKTRVDWSWTTNYGPTLTITRENDDGDVTPE
ncbi:MAG: hypothetical protein P0Y60_06150 [Candidatus Microbacterium colombiense]|nr:MAG: hypothetical protein P0Y60_06150 [Microbacterium sp.]